VQARPGLFFGLYIPDFSPMSAMMKTRSARKMVAFSIMATCFAMQADAQLSPFTFSYEGNYLPQDSLNARQWAKVLDSDPSGPNTSESVAGEVFEELSQVLDAANGEPHSRDRANDSRKKRRIC